MDDAPHPRSTHECACGDPDCGVHAILTLEEFRLHRPMMCRSLVQFADDNDSMEVRSVMPERHEAHVLFSALLESEDRGGIVLCLKGTHPLAMLEEEAPGVSTWWWEDDVREQGY